MVAEICRTLNYLGHETVTLRSDGEPACLALQRGVQAFRAKMKLKTVLEQTEAGDSQANPAEPAIEQVRQLAGTLISAYEDGAQVQVSSLHPMHSWAHRHASWLLQRYSQTHGHSCFELLTGRPYAGKIVPFGETVFGRLRSAVKGKPRWTRMIWLGKLQVSDLHFGVSETGHMLSTRSVRRVPDRFDKSMHEKVLDQPWSQAAFLSGQMGQARAQKTLADAPAPAEEAPVPLPFPGHLLPDSAMLSELIPPLPTQTTWNPEPPTPMRDDSGPVTPLHAAAPPGADVASSPLAVLPSADAPEAPVSSRVPTRAAEPGGDGPRKKLRLDAVQFDGVDMYHNHEDNHFEFDEDVLDGFDYVEDAGPAEDAPPSANIPECLMIPWSEHEPELSPEELARIDAVAMQFEVDRLLGIPALEQVTHMLPDHKRLTTRFVTTWRCKTIAGQAYWLRRARLVARDFAFLCPGRTDLFSPASNALQSKIVPAVFIDNYHKGWQLVSLDVTDAYLNCPHGEPTCTSVNIGGVTMFFKLLRLPGQREGSQRWFYQFTDELKAGCQVELMTEVPSLFRFPSNDGGGGGLVHVDDLLGTGPAKVMTSMTDHLEKNYKVSVNVISVPGQEVHFLKKRHYLLSSTELLIEVSPKHLEKLKSCYSVLGPRVCLIGFVLGGPGWDILDASILASSAIAPRCFYDEFFLRQFYQLPLWRFELQLAD